MKRKQEQELRPTNRQETFRGYLIKPSFAGNEWYISKDGAHIATAASLEAAKKTIAEHLS
jgi:hypothetical protein